MINPVVLKLFSKVFSDEDISYLSNMTATQPKSHLLVKVLRYVAQCQTLYYRIYRLESHEI